MFVGTTVVSMVKSPTSPVAEGTGLVSSTVAVPSSPVPDTPVTKTGANVSFDCAFITSSPRPVVPTTPVTANSTVFPLISKTTSPLTTFLLIGVISKNVSDSSI